MKCAWCNVTKDEILTMRRGVQLWHEAIGNCTGDGSFSLDMKASWPGPLHFLDSGLAKFILETVGDRSLLDVGAGSGQYGAFFEQQRERRIAVPAWRGIDGATNVEEFTRKHGPAGSLTRHANICDETLRPKPAEWVMSLEVGEHLPASCLTSYVQLLSRCARRGIFVSWAPPGQAGHCHVSTRGERWVRETFAQLGWEKDEALTRRAQNASTLWYLKRNTLVLVRRQR